MLLAAQRDFSEEIKNQGCAPAEPGGQWQLTFALEWLRNLKFSYKSYGGHPGFHLFGALGCLQFFLQHSVGN